MDLKCFKRELWRKDVSDLHAGCVDLISIRRAPRLSEYLHPEASEMSFPAFQTSSFASEEQKTTTPGRIRDASLAAKVQTQGYISSNDARSGFPADMDVDMEDTDDTSNADDKLKHSEAKKAKTTSAVESLQHYFSPDGSKRLRLQ